MRRRSDALHLLELFVSSHAFLHDDTWHELTEDVDELSSHPLLLLPPLTVVGDQAGNVGPTVLGLPTSPKSEIMEVKGARSPIEGLLRDNLLVDQLADHMKARGLALSTFYYGDEEVELAAMLETRGARLAVTAAEYTAANNKLDFWNRFQGPWAVPAHRVCTNLTEAIEAFYDFGGHVYVKKIHSRTVEISDANSLLVEVRNSEPPVLIEKSVPHHASPIVHYIKWQGEVRPLFILQQRLLNRIHIGNEFDPDYEDHVLSQYGNTLDACSEIVSAGPDGVVGIDFIETDDQELLPVDINVRFNSSTAPFAWLLGQIPSAERRFAIYQRHDVPVPSLEAVANDAYVDRWSVTMQTGTCLFSGYWRGGQVGPYFSMCCGKSMADARDRVKALTLAVARAASALDNRS